MEGVGITIVLDFSSCPRCINEQLNGHPVLEVFISYLSNAREEFKEFLLRFLNLVIVYDC